MQNIIVSPTISDFPIVKHPKARPLLPAQLIQPVPGDGHHVRQSRREFLVHVIRGKALPNHLDDLGARAAIDEDDEFEAVSRFVVLVQQARHSPRSTSPASGSPAAPGAKRSFPGTPAL
ncbi:hypothetical protein BC938DRAFT_479617 [Jimgerdemannia flammicorona]|uniref:Uncharacterized protein n=1 Tax=Jimgerdemannia flammicorona TaxID=994334 RepID=A0A433QKG2_9FUNG|nr:hypothetical protein BC938DRAFT_479617 [Jimgerdemannia flammicorona]